VLRRASWWLIAAAAVVGAAVLTLIGHVDWAILVITVAVLGVGLATWSATVPRPAELWVERQGELKIDDLIFYVTNQPPQPGQVQVPRDFLLQTHVAACNVGGRKAVLSVLTLEAFQDANGQAIILPTLNLPIQARIVRSRSGFSMFGNVGDRIFQIEQTSLPVILEADEVVTVQLRTRGGIDWSDAWDLARIRELEASLQRPIKRALVRAIYRRGKTLVQQDFTIELSVLQQELFRTQLRALTTDLTVRPALPLLSFPKD
jgi:hypothetical protein